ncbi:hypothetical protein GCM10022247_54350 [Allokutzneria multivorans]|uniref:Uncharacterized protein n=1 Tax=Allokutzneria multivorans TaxID=1142134 RepID=A0ABP7T9V3_9PSEU
MLTDPAPPTLVLASATQLRVVEVYEADVLIDRFGELREMASYAGR